MDIRCMDGWSAKGLPAAWVDGYIIFAYGFQNPSSVGRSVLQGSIAMDRSNPQEIQRWMMGRDEYSECILAHSCS